MTVIDQEEKEFKILNGKKLDEVEAGDNDDDDEEEEDDVGDVKGSEDEGDDEEEKDDEEDEDKVEEVHVSQSVAQSSRDVDDDDGDDSEDDEEDDEGDGDGDGNNDDDTEDDEDEEEEEGEPAMTERDVDNAYMRWYLRITRRHIMPPVHEAEMLYQPRGDTERALLTCVRQVHAQSHGALVDRSYESLLAACQTLHDISRHVLASLPLLQPVMTEIPGLEVDHHFEASQLLSALPYVLTSLANTTAFTLAPVVSDAPLDQVERPLSSKVYTRRQRALRALCEAPSSSDAIPDVEPEHIPARARGRGKNTGRRVD